MVCMLNKIKIKVPDHGWESVLEPNVAAVVVVTNIIIIFKHGGLMKQLFHLHLLDMRLVIATKACSAELAIYHLISNAHSWNNY